MSDKRKTINVHDVYHAEINSHSRGYTLSFHSKGHLIKLHLEDWISPYIAKRIRKHLEERRAEIQTMLEDIRNGN